jgi:uncharacterized protein YjiS (DUF1127 family)
MAFTESSHPIRGSLAAWAREIHRSYSAARHRRAIFLQTYRELQALSNRELDDLGLPRSEIRRIARDAARMA